MTYLAMSRATLVGSDTKGRDVEFRNHQARILHQYQNLVRGNPLATFLLGLVFLLLLIPFVVLALAVGAIVLIVTLIRIAIAQLFGGFSPRRPGGSSPFTSDAAPKTGPGAGTGTVLDAEATVRRKD